MPPLDRLSSWLFERRNSTPVSELLFGQRCGDEMFTYYRLMWAAGLVMALGVWIWVGLKDARKDRTR